MGAGVWEAAAWAGLGILAVPAARRVQPLLTARLGERTAVLRQAGPWLHGLLFPFAALFTGVLSASHLGLYGQGGWSRWVGGAVLVLALLLGLRQLVARLMIETPEIPLQEAMLDEPRWALYRGVGHLWLGDFWLGTLVGLGLSLVEWSLIQRIWRERSRKDPAACLVLARLAWSSLIFALTANLWLVLAFQLAWLLQLEREAVESHP